MFSRPDRNSIQTMEKHLEVTKWKKEEAKPHGSRSQATWKPKPHRTISATVLLEVTKWKKPWKPKPHRTISATRSDSAAEAAPLIVVHSEVVKGGEDAVEVGA